MLIKQQHKDARRADYIINRRKTPISLSAEENDHAMRGNKGGCGGRAE
jgi:hypothetical protein